MKLSHTRKSLFRRGTFVIAILVGVNACSLTTEQTRGYIIDEEIMGALQPGVDNKNSVQTVLGTPSIVGTFDTDNWYYMSSRTRKFSFLDPQLLEQKIIAISFDENETLASIARYTEEDVQSINISGRSTPTRGRKLGFWEQIFGNIGRFSGAPGGGPGGPPR